MEARKSKLLYLPDDLITDILLRSTVKSVGRFRCLSKMFYSMLSDPNFARKQLELTLRRRRSNNRRLIMSSLQKLFLVDLDSMDVEHEYSSKEDLNILSNQTHIIGSSNGLVCLMRCVWDNEEEVLLYNPTIRDSKIIPKLSESLYHKTHDQLFCSYRFGFGFDSLSNDYKVVKLISCNENEHNKYTVCYVYSLKTDSWKRINNLLPYYTYVAVSSENFKGVIHWIAITGGVVEQNNVLMAFDLEKDELREMTLSNWTDDELYLDLCYFPIDTFKGCLCVVPDGFFEMPKSIWVMKEYGVKSSWSKIGIKVSEYSIKQLCLSKNDEELLFVFDGNFVYVLRGEYYSKTKATTYVESLISPNY